ncbi:MAG TPA: hypothetical protein DCQ12_04525 [Candidatus Cloacimonas sp.]|jgi:hypothetical protein|nr:hypothetical protein [Candidatus Cloacimonas sp.]
MKRTLIALFLMLITLSLAAENAISSSIVDSSAVSEDQLLLLKLENIEKQGIKDADLYYDIGVCHHRLGNIGYATLYYLRALNLDSAHTQSRHNLNVLRKLNPDAFEPKNLYLIELLKRIIAWLNYPRLAVLILIFSLLVVICINWLLHLKPGYEKGPPVLLLSLSSLFLLIFGLSLPLKMHSVKQDSRAVVVTPQASGFKYESSTEGSTPIPQASVVKILDQRSGTYQVRTPSGAIVWMNADDLRKVVP